MIQSVEVVNSAQWNIVQQFLIIKFIFLISRWEWKELLVDILSDILQFSSALMFLLQSTSRRGRLKNKQFKTKHKHAYNFKL